MIEVLENIISHSLDICLGHDSSGQLIHMNEAGLMEFGIDSLGEMTLFDIFPEGMHEKLKYDGQIQDSMVYRKNKTCFQAAVKCISIDDPTCPNVIYIRNMSAMFSLERQAENIKAEVEDASKVKNEFVANVTHELRTPVNGILGNTRLLIGEESDPKKLDTLRTIETSCNVMHSLINNILDFSKLEAGKFTLENRKFEFRKMIDFVKSSHQPKMNEKGLNFVVSISPDIPKHIVGDELRIGQILNNLLSNACKFTSVGQVSMQAIKTNQDKNRIEIFFIVMDSGIGIDKADQDKLFKSFSQVDASISRQYGGTGLGLNISKQLVGLMGGTISVDSKKGKGTMFSFSIWVDVPDDEEISSNLSERPTAESMHHMLEENEEIVNLTSYGTIENRQEIRRLMDKLVLCIEMSNWEKAEGFANTLKSLTDDSPKEIKSAVLRLKMSVQKADYDKSMEAFDKVNAVLVDANE